MEDTAYRDFFTKPSQTYQRQYEALRAIFVDRRKQTDVAEQFGYTYGSLRQMVLHFRRFVDDHDESGESPFFEMSLPVAARPTARTKRLSRSSPTVGN